MAFLMSVTPFGDTRFVLPSGPPPSTIAAAFFFPQLVHAAIPSASRLLRSAALSVSHFARATGVPV
jgi:hypothetical protein